MKSINELQKVVDEIREVCKKHKVILLGTNYSEGIYGEITIVDSDIKNIGWIDVDKVKYNKVIDTSSVGSIYQNFCVGGIGDINKENIEMKLNNRNKEILRDIDNDADEEGWVYVGEKLFSEIIKTMPEELISTEVNEIGRERARVTERGKMVLYAMKWFS